MIVQLLIIQGLIFAAFIFLLRFLFSRNLNVAVSRLNALHEENIVKEAQLTNELHRAQQEREAEVKRGQDEAAAIIEEAKKDGINLRIKMEEDAKILVEKIIMQGKEEAEKFKAAVSKDMLNQGIDLAVEMIKQVFNEQNKMGLQFEFINQILQEIEELTPERFQVSTNNVKVISSYPLQEVQRENLQNILKLKLGFMPVLEESINPDLICGLILDMNGLVIDGTIKSRLRRLIPHLKKE